MTFFSESAFTEKLKRLVNTPESIQTLSNYIMFHKRNAKEVAELCVRMIIEASSSDEHRLVIFYLINDVVQVGKKKSPAMCDEFMKVLPNCMPTLSKTNPAVKQRVERTLSIWKDRQIFEPLFITQLSQALINPTHVPITLQSTPTPTPQPILKQTAPTLPNKAPQDLFLVGDKSKSFTPDLQSRIQGVIKSVEQVANAFMETHDASQAVMQLPTRYIIEDKLESDGVLELTGKEKLMATSQVASSLVKLDEERTAIESETDAINKHIEALKMEIEFQESRLQMLADKIRKNDEQSDRLNGLLANMKNHTASPSMDGRIGGPKKLRSLDEEPIWKTIEAEQTTAPTADFAEPEYNIPDFIATANAANTVNPNITNLFPIQNHGYQSYENQPATDEYDAYNP